MHRMPMGSPRPRAAAAACLAAALSVTILSGCGGLGHSSGQWWSPAPHQTWQFQYHGAIDTSVGAEIYNLDGEHTPDDAIRTLKKRGRRLVCYFNAGAWEPYRHDAEALPTGVRGKVMKGWEDEKWLDVRQLDVLMPVMTKRIENCKKRGFDAVDPDNMDGYDNATGKNLSTDDAISYFRALAEVAHRNGLSIGLKNAIDIIPELLDVMDFAVNEQCHEYRECGVYKQVLERGKGVVNIEYPSRNGQACFEGMPGMTTIMKTEALTETFRTCDDTKRMRPATTD